MSLKRFIIKGPQQNSKKCYITKSSKNVLTATASNRFSASKGILQTLIETMIAKSDDKFVTHNMKWGNTDLISTRFCRRISASYCFICKYRKNVLGCVYQYVTNVCDVYMCLVFNCFVCFGIYCAKSGIHEII